MEFIDIAFPLRLGRLTYRVPQGMNVRPGDMVRAEVRRSIRRGIVLGPARSRPRGAIKDIQQVEPHGLGEAMARLIEWMADYYFAAEGMVVKTIFPQEFFDAVKARRQRKPVAVSEPFSPYGTATFKKALDALETSVRKGQYRTHLVQAPSTIAELSFAVEAAKTISGDVIVCAPEHAWIEHIEGALREAVGESALVSYHAGLSAGNAPRPCAG